MSKFLKAATVAAISVTLGSSVITADPGFAFGNSDHSRLEADTIQIDIATLEADQESVQLAREGKVEATLADNGDIIFTPGTATNAVTELDQVTATERADTISASSLAELVQLQDSQSALSAEEKCLAGTVYFESKGESLAGQLAVARVVMARAKSGRFPSSLCGVVYQKSQFSFVRGGSMPAMSTGSKHWRNAVAISRIALSDAWESPVEGALFFHARHVSPGWRLQRIGAIDNHIFYR
jgi:spore germination cell wall hydrolase CwlJ-like protein